MNNDHLVNMCNQIGTFFESMTDRDQALEDFAKHIKNFWAPSMRHQILSQIEQGEATELSQIATDALAKHRALLQ